MRDEEYIDNIAFKYGAEIDNGHNYLASNNVNIVELIDRYFFDITPQQNRIKRIINNFDKEINNKKTLTKLIWTGKLIQEINLQLFGFLGNYENSKDSNEEYPYRCLLENSKQHFNIDLESMVRVVKKWNRKGDVVKITPEVSFSISGDSGIFFDKLFFLSQFNSHNRTSYHYYSYNSKQFFGVYPGERQSKRILHDWDPIKTAILVRSSLEKENTINKIGEIINGYKEEAYLELINSEKKSMLIKKIDSQIFKNFGYIEQKYDDILKNNNTFIDNVTKKNLLIEDILLIKAEEYLNNIDHSILYELEGFIEGITQTLSDEVPFLLTPNLYLLIGPIIIRTNEREVYKDPLLILRFEEFPKLLIPIDYWLPCSLAYSYNPRGNQHNDFVNVIKRGKRKII